MRISRISLSVLATIVLFSCSKVELTPNDLLLDIDAAANTGNQSSNAEFVPNEMLVKFKKGTPENTKAKALGLLNASLKEHIHTAAMKRAGDDQGVLLLKVNVNALDAIAKAGGFGEIEYAEPNWVYQHQATSNDTYFTNGLCWECMDLLHHPQTNLDQVQQLHGLVVKLAVRLSMLELLMKDTCIPILI